MSATIFHETQALAQAAMAAAQPQHPAAPRECLTFRVGGEAYGIDILQVQEIRSYERPTRMAGAAPFINGVINLRGVIVPIFDLRLYFELPDARYDGSTVVVVLNLGDKVIGAVVDSVSDVMQLQADQVKPMPGLHGPARANHILGIASIERPGDPRMVILIDIEALLLEAHAEQAALAA